MGRHGFITGRKTRWDIMDGMFFKRMKRGSLVLLSVLLLCLSGCTSQPAQGQSSGTSVAEEAAESQTGDTGFVDLTEDAGTLAPKNVLDKALRLTQPEVESALDVTLSEDSKNPRSGGYLVDCDVSFGDVSATQLDFQFNKVNQEDQDLLLLAVGYQFEFETAQEGWETFQAMSQAARNQGAKAMTQEYYSQESGFVRYGTFEEFDAGARESTEKSGLPTVECVDLFYVDERTTCEYSFTYAPDQGFIATVFYGADVNRSVGRGNTLK